MTIGAKSFGLIISTILLITAPSWAVITVEGVSNASAYDAGSSIVYGGIAGNDTCGGSVNLCNSCTLGTLTACNKQRINAATILTFVIKSDTVDGYPMLAKDSDGSQVKINSSAIVTKGNTGTLTVTWGEICNVITAGLDATCLTDGTSDLNKGLAFKIGISAAADSSLATAGDDAKTISMQVQRTMIDLVPLAGGSSALGSNGIFGFSVYPGDAKVYLEDLAAHANFPISANGTSYTKVHLLSKKNFADCGTIAGVFSHDMLNDAESFKTVDLDGSELTDDRFFGYENDVTYTFKIALEDRAGNIGNFTDDADCVAGHIATPGEIFGLLKDRQNCFIATAAYGSTFDPSVQTFREFRDQVLIKYKWGRRFVSTYYDFSPKLAATIAENEQLRTLSRVALYPLWIFAALSLHYGFLAAVIIFGVLIMAPLLIFRGLRKGINT